MFYMESNKGNFLVATYFNVAIDEINNGISNKLVWQNFIERMNTLSKTFPEAMDDNVVHEAYEQLCHSSTFHMDLDAAMDVVDDYHAVNYAVVHGA